MLSASKIANQFSQPLDRAAIAVIAVLTVAIALLLFGGDSTAPRVRDFSWEDREIGAEERAFIVTFSRPMDRASVEENLEIEPALPGKISWAGQRMAYTLDRPLPYGMEFELEIEGARDRFDNPETATPIDPYVGRFKSRDRAIVYLGVEEQERGQLILYNLTQGEKTVLTEDLMVMDYEPYPKGDRILFSASDRHAGSDGLLEQKLYTVTTGRDGKPPGKIELVLDAKNYQNFSFDLSSDGSTILVQRLKKGKRGKVGLWMIKQGKKAKPLEAEPGGEFLITPDSNAIAIAQGQGLAILPLEANAEPLEFLPKFAQVLDFSRNGAAAAMVKFNTDYTRSLFLVTNTGVQKELRRIKGSILDAEFSPDGKILYTLLTTLIEGEEYREEPYIAAINLETEEATTLVLLPKHREIQMSLSPDGLGLLFDQISTINRGRSQGSEAMPRTDSGEAIVASRLWLLPLDPSIPPEEMEDLTPVDFPFPGLRPEWLP